MTYCALDANALGEKRQTVLEEVRYAKKHGNTSIPLPMTVSDALADLLRKLADMAHHAPGEHGTTIAVAVAWAQVLDGSAPQ